MSRIPSTSSGEAPVRLDVAVHRVMTEPVDAITGAELGSLQTAMRARNVTADGIDPPNLVGAVFTFIMPRLSNPAVLRFERRRLILERLEARVSASVDGAPLVPGALMALRHELGNLRMLQQNRDSLIGG